MSYRAEHFLSASSPLVVQLAVYSAYNVVYNLRLFFSQYVTKISEEAMLFPPQSQIISGVYILLYCLRNVETKKRCLLRLKQKASSHAQTGRFFVLLALYPTGFLHIP